MNDNKKVFDLSLIVRVAAMGLAIGSVYSATNGRLDEAVWCMLSAIFFELYNIETRLRK